VPEVHTTFVFTAFSLYTQDECYLLLPMYTITVIIAESLPFLIRIRLIIRKNTVIALVIYRSVVVERVVLLDRVSFPEKNVDAMEWSV